LKKKKKRLHFFIEKINLIKIEVKEIMKKIENCNFNEVLNQIDMNIKKIKNFKKKIFNLLKKYKLDDKFKKFCYSPIYFDNSDNLKFNFWFLHNNNTFNHNLLFQSFQRLEK
jgi:hypothetical protein